MQMFYFVSCLVIQALLQQSSAASDVQEITSVPCDPTHSCPTGNTCCPDLSGHWICCPQGHMCMFGKCVSMSESISIPSNTDNTDALVKVPASPVQSSASSDVQENTSVRCDLTHYCPTGNTCCRHRYGQWACCPMRYAVCCMDRLHCCPHGYRCAIGRCVRRSDSTSIPWSVKTDALVKVSSSPVQSSAASDVQENTAVMCDLTHYCPTGNTCCRHRYGQWGCCPMRHAVCCMDDKHCCPHGHMCVFGKCISISDSTSIPWSDKTDALVKVPASPVQSSAASDIQEITSVRCDRTHYCPTGNTCCMHLYGQWGCCPMRHAVCCADQKHCCPFGHYCTPFGKCIRMSDSASPQLTNNERYVEPTKTSSAEVMEKLHFSPESDEFTEF